MKRNLHLTLSVVMIGFALCISLSLSAHYYFETKQLKQEHENSMLNEHIAQLRFAIETNEKAIYHFGNTIAEQMNTTSIVLSRMYNMTKSFEDWNFQSLSEQFNADIYIINEENRIEYSNLFYEVGLDFDQCCNLLAAILDERRESGLFFHDGLEVEQATGELKKYSYMSTPDKKYIIQLGIYWKNTHFHNAFQYDTVVDKLINERLNDIRVLNVAGNPLGTRHSNYKLADKNHQAFMEAIQSNTTVVLEPEYKKSTISYMYIPIISQYDESYTSSKVIELVYNKAILNESLSKLTKLFLIQILFILIVTVLLSLYIAHIFSKPIFLAFHDPLTRIGNRAYLSEYANRLIVKHKPFTFLMFDIDNFKKVNDFYGHAIGDEVIQKTAALLAEHSKGDGYAFRLGGDEFVVILSTYEPTKVEEKVASIVKQFDDFIAADYRNNPYPVTLSIGIAYAKLHGCNLDDIMTNADKALYEAKQAGKNQWMTYKKEEPS